MFRIYQVLSLFGFVALAGTLVGCSKEQAPAPPAVVEEEIVEQVEVPELSPSDVTDAMATLSETDRAAVLAQQVCPVSDQSLGSMGTPIKVTVNGRDVFLCCESCREKLEANPDEYLAKLDAN